MLYAVVLLFYASRRWLVMGLVAWGAAIVASNLLLVPSGWLRYPLSWLNIEFMFGGLSAWAVKSAVYRGDPKPLSLLGLAAASAMLFMIHHLPANHLRLLFVLGLACMMVGFAPWEQSASLPWPGWLLLLGNASYSIYLIHNPLVSITQRLAARIGLGWVGAMVFGVVLSVLAGYVYYLLVERRFLDFFRSRFVGRSNDGVLRPGA